MGVTGNAVRRTMKSEDAGRLLQLASEHASIMREIAVEFDSYGPRTFVVTGTTLMILHERIFQIEEERDLILMKYK